MDDFGSELKKLRKEKGLSIRELGKRSGISHSYLSQIENGKRGVPTRDLLQKLSSALGIDYSYLLMKTDHLIQKTFYEEKDNNQFLNYKNNPDEFNKLNLFDKKIPVTIQVPLTFNYELIEGGFMNKFTSPEDVFHLEYLLDMKIDLYYKEKKLTKDEKSKIKSFLQTLLD